MNIKQRIRAFHEWQQQSYTVAPMGNDEHTCSTCGTRFIGNYCPRCGQSSRIGRYSLKAALLMFFDVWGLGNRSMFRTLRDLILRPGYMIRDYLGGMQMAYFPPFKLLFLLTALSLLIAHGMNIKGINMTALQQEQAYKYIQHDKDELPVVQNMNNNAEKIVNVIIETQERFPNAISLAFILSMTVVFFFFFRNRRIGEKLTFTEFFITMIYASNLISIAEIVLTFFCVNAKLVSFASVLVALPLKQLTGFSWWSTMVRLLASLAIVSMFFILLGIVSTI